MDEPTPKGRHRWLPQIQGRGHGGHHRHQGLGVSLENGDRRSIAALRQPVQLRGQPGKTRGPEGRIHHKSLDPLGGTRILWIEAEGLPDRLPKGTIGLTAIGHPQAEGQSVPTDVHGGSRPIEQPAPAAAAVMAALAIAAHGDGAGAADHHDAGPLRKGTPQGGALVTGHQQSLGG